MKSWFTTTAAAVGIGLQVRLAAYAGEAFSEYWHGLARPELHVTGPALCGFHRLWAFFAIVLEQQMELRSPKVDMELALIGTGLIHFAPEAGHIEPMRRFAVEDVEVDVLEQGQRHIIIGFIGRQALHTVKFAKTRLSWLVHTCTA